jgi:surfactin synthase thioesterase subunit
MKTSDGIAKAVVRPVRKPDATRLLICVGYCGGGTAPFRDWESQLADDTELAMVVYPGREGRYHETLLESWEDLTSDTVASVLAVADRPYVLFGHSMGGWVAFDAACRIERAGGPPAQRLVVSSCNAPQLGVTDRDRFPAATSSDAELAAWMSVGGLLPGYVRADPDLMEMALELMRADVKVRDSYRPGNPNRTKVPVRVLHGADDAMIDPGVAARWGEVCHGPVHVQRLAGGHFYTPDIWRTLPSYILDPGHLERSGPGSPNVNGGG